MCMLATGMEKDNRYAICQTNDEKTNQNKLW